MVSQGVWVHAQQSASFHYDFLGRAIDSESRVSGIPILPVMNVNETLAIYQSCEPPHLIRVFPLQRKRVRELVDGLGS